MTEPDHDMELVERLCRIQHDAYEAAAAEHGWSTQQASRRPWDQVPAENRATMEASMLAVLAELFPRRSMFAGPHTLAEVDDQAVTFRRVVRINADIGGPMDLRIDRGSWVEWGRPLDVFVTTLIMGRPG